MEFKYYESFFFLEKNYEVNPSDQDIYYKTYFEESLSINVSEYYYKNKCSRIYYHDVTSFESVKNFHEVKYPDKSMFTVKHLKNTVILESFNQKGLVSTDIFNFDKNKKEVSNIALDGESKLVEYRDVFYEQGKEVKEKIVFKTTHHWHVVEEDLTNV